MIAEATFASFSWSSPQSSRVNMILPMLGRYVCWCYLG